MLYLLCALEHHMRIGRVTDLIYYYLYYIYEESFSLTDHWLGSRCHCLRLDPLGRLGEVDGLVWVLGLHLLLHHLLTSRPALGAAGEVQGGRPLPQPQR